MDSQVCGHDDVRSPVHWHTVRCLRVWTSPKTTTASPSNEMSVAMRCFTPHQITTRGCCGARRPIFESLTTLWDRARNWIELSGYYYLILFGKSYFFNRYSPNVFSESTYEQKVFNNYVYLFLLANKVFLNLLCISIYFD